MRVDKRSVLVWGMVVLSGLLVSGCRCVRNMSGSSSLLIHDGDTIAFLGDSITAGGAAYGKYCRLVVQGLKTKDLYVKPILAGVSGNTSEDMLTRLDKDVLQYEPDWVVLAAGVNDVWHTDPTAKIGVFQPKPGMGVELPAYKKNIKEIVARCQAKGAKVLLTTITPIREDPETNLNIKARDYNAFLVELAHDRGIPIAPLNEMMFSAIAKGQQLTSDGVHPLQIGHQIMAKGILQTIGCSEEEADAMEEEWESAPSILILGDRQTTSGTREGGWCHMLMDGMNLGREMVTYRIKASYRHEVTVASMRKDFENLDAFDDYWVIMQATRGDAINETPLDAYRKDVTSLVATIREKASRPLLVTIPVQENDPAGALSQKCDAYNDVLRAVAKETKTPLADMNKLMKEQHAAKADVRLTYDGERFNREGSLLMAETILRTLGLAERLTPVLDTLWDEREFYAE